MNPRTLTLLSPYRLPTDSTLYRETTATVIQFRELLTDIKANPKKYLKISVF